MKLMKYIAEQIAELRKSLFLLKFSSQSVLIVELLDIIAG